MTCQHQACTCNASSGTEFCSLACANGEESAVCDCRHDECEASATGSRAVDGDAFDPHTVAESVTAPDTVPEYDGRP